MVKVTHLLCCLICSCRIYENIDITMNTESDLNGDHKLLVNYPPCHQEDLHIHHGLKNAVISL